MEEQHDLEEDTTEQFEDYKDMPIEIMPSSKKRFLTWGEFDD